VDEDAPEDIVAAISEWWDEVVEPVSGPEPAPATSGRP
jgi:hypothetical protein